MSKFGSPTHDSIWFENKSLGFPNGAYYDNLMNDIRSWRRDALSSNSLFPFTSVQMTPGCSTDAEDEEYSIIQVTGPESNADETETDSENEEITFQNRKLNKRNYDTLWKLYRNVGESIDDMKNRLIGSPSSNKRDMYIESNIHKNDSQNENIYDQSPKIEYIYRDYESSSSGEYESNPDSTINENAEKQIEEINSPIIVSKEYEENEFIDKCSTDCDFVYSSNFNDILDIELSESNENIIFSNDYDEISRDDKCSDLSCKSSIEYYLHDSNSFDSIASDCTFDVPRLQAITTEELVRKKAPIKKKRTKSIAAKSEDNEEIKSSEQNNGPIICDMYGIRTINYNDETPKIKISDCFKTSRLSDSSCDEELELVQKVDFQVSKKEHSNKKKSTFEVLKNRFQNIKRKRSNNNDFWNSFGVDLSSDSEATDDYMKIKKFKVCFSKEMQVISDTMHELEEALEEQLEPESSTTSSPSSSSNSSSCTRSSCSCSCSCSSKSSN